MTNKMKEIKTFEDACKAVGIDHDGWCQVHDGIEKDVLAYLKLRIITEALNEGWFPKYTEDERRYWPWFWLITKEEYDSLTEEQKSRCFGRASHNANAYGGLVYAYASGASSLSGSHRGSRLAFRTRELAIYAGKTFIDIYADFYFEIRQE